MLHKSKTLQMVHRFAAIERMCCFGYVKFAPRFEMINTSDMSGIGVCCFADVSTISF